MDLTNLRSKLQEGDGVFAPGGAHANLLAILAARNTMQAGSKRVRFFWSCLKNIFYGFMYA